MCSKEPPSLYMTKPHKATYCDQWVTVRSYISDSQEYIGLSTSYHYVRSSVIVSLAGSAHSELLLQHVDQLMGDIKERYDSLEVWCGFSDVHTVITY